MSVDFLSVGLNYVDAKVIAWKVASYGLAYLCLVSISGILMKWIYLIVIVYDEKRCVNYKTRRPLDIYVIYNR